MPSGHHAMDQQKYVQKYIKGSIDLKSFKALVEELREAVSESEVMLV